MAKITELLQAWNQGDEHAMDELLPLVDSELKKLAHNYMRNERPDHILQTTALVHEALMKLIRENISYESRGQFYGFVSKRMRRVLIDYARKEGAKKRGGRPERVDLTEADAKTRSKSDQVLLLEAALVKLAEFDERKAKIVECRFFIGLTLAETAEVLHVAPATIERDWEFTRAWLQHEIAGGQNEQ